jgi:TetR/AcrR family transcriptional regulator, transcriptional repressor for nem operon
MENKPTKADRTRQFIIETTAALFNTKGYEGTSMSDITEATGLTKGSIYGNFTNKEEVALAVFDHNLDIILKSIREKVALAQSYHDKLMIYAKVYGNYNRAPFPQGGCPILNTAVEADDTAGLLKERAAKAVIRWKRGIMNLIQGGMNTGEFNKNVDQERIALSMIALIEGGMMIAKVTDTPTVMDVMLRAVSALIDELESD